MSGVSSEEKVVPRTIGIITDATLSEVRSWKHKRLIDRNEMKQRIFVKDGIKLVRNVFRIMFCKGTIINTAEWKCIPGEIPNPTVTDKILVATYFSDLDYDHLTPLDYKASGKYPAAAWDIYNVPKHFQTRPGPITLEFNLAGNNRMCIAVTWGWCPRKLGFKVDEEATKEKADLSLLKR